MNPEASFEHFHSRLAAEGQHNLQRELSQHDTRLTQLSRAGETLTHDRLRHVSPDSLDVAREAVRQGIEWPDHASAVMPTKKDIFSPGLSPDDADKGFAEEILHGRRPGAQRRGYNNFPAIIGSPAYIPSEANPFMKKLSENPSAAIYGSKPYLVRAYLVAPEFMQALQQEVQTRGGSAGWGDALLRGAENPQAYPYDKALLRASRVAYGLLINLMRRDDCARQAEWLGLNSASASPIHDPHHELWT